MKRVSILSAAALALASSAQSVADVSTVPADRGESVRGWIPKRAPTYSATPAAPIDKAAKRAKAKAAAKARTAQRMRNKGKR